MTPPHTVPTQRQLLNLAIPGMLAALAVPVAELVDLAFLGHLQDVNQLSGVVLAMVIFDYIFWSFGFLRMGTTGLVAQAHGANDDQEQANLFWRAFLLALFFGGLLTVLQYPIGIVGFSLLAGGNAVEQAGQAYYMAHIWGSIPTLANYACIGWLLGRGRADMVFLISLIWQGTNIILDYWFIVIEGWGAAGAGYAIMIAEWCGMLTAIFCVLRSWGGVPSFSADEVFHWSKARALMVLNSAILVRTFLLISVLAAFTNISATFGATILAANAILMRLWSTTAYVIDGFAIALETLGGKYYGQSDQQALRRSFLLTMRWNVFITMGFLMLYGLGNDWIFQLMTDHEEVIMQAQLQLNWLLLTLVVGGVAFVYDGFFLGLARPGLLMRSMVLSCLFFVPFAVMAFYNASLSWLWAGMLIFTTARAVTLAFPAMRYLRTE